jgi:hypothetical protein
MDDPGTDLAGRLGDVAGTQGVHGEGGGLVGFRIVHPGPCCGIDDDVEAANSPAYRSEIANVAIAGAGRRRVFATVSE